MKKIIIVVIIMVLISINYLGAKDKETLDPSKDKTLMPLKGYLPLPAKYAYSFFRKGVTKETKKADFLDCIEAQRRIIGFGRMGVGDEIKNFLNEYKNSRWITVVCMEDKGYVRK